MQKEGNLINTNILLTTLRGYEKLMNAKERETFYKMIKNFSEAEKELNRFEEEINREMDNFEESQEQVLKSFVFIMEKFDGFLKKYDEMSENVIDSPFISNKEIEGDIDGDVVHNCGDECKCKKDLKGFKEFLSSKEGNELLENLFSLFNGELQK